MARPKGVIQKRDESKYWLPNGVTLAPDHPDIYRQDTKLVFIDSEFGEFVSYFKALQLAEASTHPKAVQKRREITNINKYGGTNPSHSKEVRRKASDTMEKLYGVRHALHSQKFIDKSMQTTTINHGVKNSMLSDKIVKKMEQTTLDRHGVRNGMQSSSIRKKLQDSNLKKYGVTNPGGLPQFIEKAFKTMTDNGNGRPASKGELEMLEFVRSLGLDANKGYVGGANPKELDIKIKEKNIAIEYNGVYWHSMSRPQMYKDYHYDKMMVCAASDYKLLQFFDFEWSKRQDQVKSFLRSALGKNEVKLNGRQTEIRYVPKPEAFEFLEKYHILGKANHLKAFGLYFNNELQCMITIGLHHRNNSEFVLNRYVGKENVTVRGGLQKLVKAAVTEYGTISTWIDLRMSNGANWLTAGWEQVSILKPDYFYYDPATNKIISKQSRAKRAVNTPSNMTEYEHAQQDGLHRVYDCGKIKLIYRKVR